MVKLFKHLPFAELNYDLDAETTDSGRKYVTPQGESYSSITTVLAAYNIKKIMEWRQRVGAEEANRVAGRASRRGTKLHSICESYLKNEITPMKMQTMMPSDKENFLKLKDVLYRSIDIVFALEQALYSDRLRVAGRVDCIATWNGKISVIDFKTSTSEKNEENIENYFMQCSAYAEMFEERTGVPIEQIVVVIAVENGTNQVFVKNKHKYLDKLHYYINKHYKTTVV
jgi:genome maintenance exonuclease 1